MWNWYQHNLAAVFGPQPSTSPAGSATPARLTEGERVSTGGLDRDLNFSLFNAARDIIGRQRVRTPNSYDANEIIA